jgi:hypothetical protein
VTAVALERLNSGLLLLLSRSYFLGIINSASYLLQGECALGVPLELRQTVADMRRAAPTEAESANVFTGKILPALVTAIRSRLTLPKIAEVTDGGFASSSAFAFVTSESCEWRLRGATLGVCNSKSFRLRLSSLLGKFASRAMSFVAVEVGSAIAAGQANEQPPRPTFGRWRRFSS